MPLYLHKLKRPAVFLHVPRTGGTTIEAWLEEVYGNPPLFFSKHPSAGSESTPQHYGYQTLMGLLDDVNDASLFKFSIVRDPYSRLESEFFYRVNMRTINLGKHPEKMFSAWLCDSIKKAKSCPNILDNHLRPQCYFNNKDVHIYKFENGFDKIHKNLVKELDAQTPKSLSAKKVGKKKKVIWSNAAIVSVNEFYHEDFTKFDYPPKNIQAVSLTQRVRFTYFTMLYSVLTCARNLKHRLRKTFN